MSLHNRTGTRRPASPNPALLVGASWVRVDPAARARARGLLKAVPAHQTASGVLRFETAGSVTDRLVRTRRAELRIAGRTLNIMLRAPSNARG